MNQILIIISGLVFIGYGLLCLSINHMKAEFERYQLAHFRKLVGVLELLGGIGMLCGLFSQYLLMIASAGLGVLMLMGTVIRLKTKDPFWEMIPALSLMALNFYIFYNSI